MRTHANGGADAKAVSARAEDRQAITASPANPKLAKLLQDILVVNQRAADALKAHDSIMDGAHPQTDRDAWYMLIGIKKHIKRAIAKAEGK